MQLRELNDEIKNEISDLSYEFTLYYNHSNILNDNIFGIEKKVEKYIKAKEQNPLLKVGAKKIKTKSFQF